MCSRSIAAPRASTFDRRFTPQILLAAALALGGCGGGHDTALPTAPKPLPAPYLTYDQEGIGLLRFAEGGGRLIGTSGTGVLRRDAGHWVHDDQGLGNNIVDGVWVDDTGEAWAGTRQPCADGNGSCAHLWHSPQAGAAWTEVAQLPAAFQHMNNPVWISGTPARGPVIVSSVVRGTSYGYSIQRPAVLRWTGSAWTDLGLPLAVADSLLDGVRSIATRGSDEVYVGSAVEWIPSQNAFAAYTSLGALGAGGWTFSAIAPPNGYCTSTLRSLRTAVGGPTYGVASGCGQGPSAPNTASGSETALVAVAAGRVTIAENPLTVRGTAINQLAVGPGGRLLLVHDHGVVWQRDDASWRTYDEYAFPGDLTPFGEAWWAADGTLWIGGVSKAAGGLVSMVAIHIALR